MIRDVTGDDPISTDAYICNYSDLKVKGVMMDEIMRSPDGHIKIPEIIVDYESK